MGFMDELKRLARPYEDEDDYVEELEDEVADEPRERPRRASREERSSYAEADTSDRRSTGNVVNINTTTQLQVVLVNRWSLRMPLTSQTTCGTSGPWC